jgi:hypothetical protein
MRYRSPVLSAEVTGSRTDVVRQAVTVVGGIAQVVLPALLLPRFRRTEAPPDVVQPAPWTFAVWLPVYAVSLVHVADQARPDRRTDPALRAAGWPLATAYAALGAWAPLLLRDRFWAAQGVLVVTSAAAGVARRRVVRAEQADGPAAVRTVLGPAAALSAWGTAAAGVNLAAMVAAYGPVPGRRGRRGLALATLAALSGAATTAMGRAGPPTVTIRTYGSVVLWALAGIVAGWSRRDRVVAAAAGTAAVPVLAALLHGGRAAPGRAR